MSACAALALLDLKPMDRVQVRFYQDPPGTGDRPGCTFGERAAGS
jgi:hypothetical protein